MGLIEKEMAGVETKQMQCSGMWSSGTTFITFSDVKVPVANLIGGENKGFMYIMNNFNHERWALCVQSNRFARVCLEESVKYAMRRKTFGKRLIDHPVIRWKVGDGPDGGRHAVDARERYLPDEADGQEGGQREARWRHCPVESAVQQDHGVLRPRGLPDLRRQLRHPRRVGGGAARPRRAPGREAVRTGQDVSRPAHDSTLSSARARVIISLSQI